MSVRVSMDTAVSHLLQPGDYVDILAFIRGGRGKAPKASTILQAIEVFAINDQFSIQDDGGSSIQAKTVSVQVTPQEASTLMFYAEQGRLRLTLRSREDNGGAVNEPVAQTEPTPPTPPKKEEEPQEESFRMELLDGSGAVRQFVWSDNESLPREITEDSSFNSNKTTTEEATGEENVPPFGIDAEGLEGEFGGLSGDSLEGGAPDARSLNIGIEF